MIVRHMFNWMVRGSYLARGTDSWRCVIHFVDFCVALFGRYVTLFTVNIYNIFPTSAQLYVAVRMLLLFLINYVYFFSFITNVYGLKLNRK